MLQPTKRCEDAAALYFGDVMHARLKPMGHRFSYRVMSLLIDLDRLVERHDRLGAVAACHSQYAHHLEVRARSDQPRHDGVGNAVLGRHEDRATNGSWGAVWP